MSEQSSHKQILKSSAIIGSASIINILIGLIRQKALAVLLGPAGIGLIGMLQTVMSTVSSVSGLGLSTSGNRQIAEANGRGDQASLDQARRALFWGTLFLSAFGAAIMWLFRHELARFLLDAPDKANHLGWLSIGVALSIAAGSQTALLGGLRRIADIAKFQVLSSTLSLLFGVSAIWAFGERGILIFILTIPLSAFLLGHFFVSRIGRVNAPFPGFKSFLPQWRKMASIGIPFMLAGLATGLGMLMARSIIQRELGSVEQGYFQAAWTISMTYLGFVLGAMGTDYYPRLTSVIHDHEHANRLVNEQIEVVLLLAGPVIIALLGLAPWAITLMYSTEFAPATDILRLQLLGDVLKITAWPLGFVILSAGAGKTYMLTESLAMVVFVLCIWELLPEVGIISSGIGFIVMYCFYLPVVYALARWRTGLQISAEVKVAFVSLMLAVLAVFVSALWNDLSGAFLGVAFGVLLGFINLLKIIKKAELSGPVKKIATFAKLKLAKIGIKID